MTLAGLGPKRRCLLRASVATRRQDVRESGREGYGAISLPFPLLRERGKGFAPTGCEGSHELLGDGCNALPIAVLQVMLEPEAPLLSEQEVRRAQPVRTDWWLRRCGVEIIRVELKDEDPLPE